MRSGLRHLRRLTPLLAVLFFVGTPASADVGSASHDCCETSLLARDGTGTAARTANSPTPDELCSMDHMGIPRARPLSDQAPAATALLASASLLRPGRHEDSRGLASRGPPPGPPHRLYLEHGILLS